MSQSSRATHHSRFCSAIPEKNPFTIKTVIYRIYIVYWELYVRIPRIKWLSGGRREPLRQAAREIQGQFMDYQYGDGLKKMEGMIFTKRYKRGITAGLPGYDRTQA
jgi:hypothetical protein